jgi:ABC-type uncharacterized transport system involved in gliding motility auxiliary subunit
MKLVATNWKYLKYLFWLGPMLIIAGLSAGVVAASWGAVPLGLIAAGIAVVIAWSILSGQSIRSFWGRRSTQAGGNALVATVAMLVILGLINFLGVRYDKRIDLTENQLFTLSPQSIEVVKALKQPVKIWIFDSDPNPQDRELLEKYNHENAQVTYEYADPKAKPGLAQKFGVQSVGEIYAESGEKRKFIQSIRPEQRIENQVVEPGERLSERKVTSGLKQINSDRQLKAYFLQGHGEKALQAGPNGLSQAVAQLGEESYAAAPLNLIEAGKVPDDADVLIVAGPQRELLAAEIKMLQDYLKHKSGLMLLVDPLTKPGLDDLLKQWGVTLSNLLVLDPNAARVPQLGLTVAVVRQYGDHPITKEFGSGYSFYPIAQPLKIVDTANEAEIPLIFTSEQVQEQPVAANGQLDYNPNRPPQGPLTLGVALSRSVSAASNQANASPTPSPNAGNEPKPSASEARLVVIGDSDFAADSFFGQQLNRDVFLNSVDWLSQQGEQILSIRPKEMTNRRIVLDAQQQALLGGGSLLLLPLLGFGAAFFSWWRRR